MSYLENKIETAIKFLNKPVSCLTQVDVDAVTSLLKDMQNELDQNLYRLVFYTRDGNKQLLAKSALSCEALEVIPERFIEDYQEETLFNKQEIAKLKREYNLISWDNVICVQATEEGDEQ